MYFTTSSFFLFHLTTGIIFPVFGKVLVLGCLECVSNKKGVYLKKNQLVKKFSTCNINFQLAKFTF